ncbi:MAG: response regulator transcription factor [Opitutaceae bacterium]|nr:response regulator transcription factor [Opitutaceae bacterium]
MKRLVIIEDQNAVREMLVAILGIDSAFEIVGQASDGQAGVQLCLETSPDICILDAKLPGLNGVDVLRRVRKKLPDLRTLVFSGYESPQLLREMLAAGANGFVEKTASLSELRSGLETIASGRDYFSPAITSLLRTVAAHPERIASASDPLTNREREILQLVAESYSTREIAGKLGLSSKTVDNHRTNLMRKLNLHDVASLTRHALETGLVQPRAAL